VDDRLEIVDNVTSTRLWLVALLVARKGWTTSQSRNGQWAEWHFGEPNYRLSLANVALHLIASLLAWRLFTRLDCFRMGGGAVVALHPLAVESVAWIAEFKTSFALYSSDAATAISLRSGRPKRYYVLA